MSEVDGKHAICKLFDFFNDESLSTSGPADDITVFFVLNEWGCT